MARFRALSRAHSTAAIAKGVAGVGSASLAALQKATPEAITENLGQGAGGFVVALQGNVWWSIPLLLVFIPALDFFLRIVGNPKVWKVIHGTLDQFRDTIFGDIPDAHSHEHRVTLFEYVSWAGVLRRWPWSGWLVPVERSGHTTQRSSAVFLTPDDAYRAEGVAGQTWSRRKIVIVEDLPDVSTGDANAVQEYARKTWMKESVVRRANPRARSLCGVPVEVKGQIWGVLVIDSCNPKLKREVVTEHCKSVVKFVGMTLEVL